MGRSRDIVDHLFTLIDGADVLQDLTTAVPYLSEAEQAIVQYLLHNPRSAVQMNSAELAEAVGVSQATVFRLCRHLNFSGFAALRDQLKLAVDRYGERFVKPTLATQAQAEGLDPLQTNIYAGVRSLVDVGSVPLEDLVHAATEISQAVCLHICGLGPISARLAEMTAFTFQRLGRTCMLWTDIQTLDRDYTSFNRDDVVLALSHSGANTAIAKFLKRARKESASTIAIVNYGRSVVAEAAHIPLITRTRESKVQNFDLLPRLPQLAVVQMLANLVSEQTKRNSNDH